MRLKLSKNLIRLLGFPTIMVSPFGKLIWVYSLRNVIKSNSLNAIFGIVIFVLIISCAVLANTIKLSYYGLLDLAIIINFLVISSMSISREHCFNVEKLRYYILPFFIFVLISALFGRVFMYNDYGQPRIVLGFGPASASILFSLLVIIFWQDLKLKIFSIILIVSVLLLILSGGRTPIAVAGLIVLLSPLNKSIKRNYAYALIGSVAIVLYVAGFFDSLLVRSGISNVSSLSEMSTSGRSLVWAAVYNAVPYEFFRVSLGNQHDILSAIRLQIGFNEDQYHSELLRMYVIFGVSGVVWYLLILVSFIVRVFICVRPIMSSCIVALLLIGITDNTLVYLHFWALLYLCAEKVR